MMNGLHPYYVFVRNKLEKPLLLSLELCGLPFEKEPVFSQAGGIIKRVILAPKSPFKLAKLQEQINLASKK